MKLNTVLKRAAGWYAAGISIHLSSSPGRGKSTTIEALPELLGKTFGKSMGLVVVNGAMLTPMDVLGYGIPKHHDNWSEMIFTDPFLMRTREGKRMCEYDGGILFVDEADKADVDVKKVLGEGALSKRFGPHTLPPGWIVWTAGNTDSDRSGSTKELDHLINRRMEIKVTDDLESLKEYGAKVGVMPITEAFMENNPQIVFTPGVPEKQGPWMTPRSLFALDKYLQVISAGSELVPDDMDTQEEAAGMVGHAATAAYFSFVKLAREMPRFEDIVAAPERAKLPPETAPDARMLVCYTLAHRVTHETIEAVVTYIKRMPVSFATTFARAACQRSPSLAVTPSLLSWSKENASLMTALASVGK